MQKKLSKVTFGIGCFWSPEYFFSKLNGVYSTRVGYSGGTLEKPNYKNLGDHTEVIEITYNNSRISFTKLLEHFWREHDPTKIQEVQYQSLILYHNQYQRELANSSKNQIQKEFSKIIKTKILPLKKFYKAEEYHQKYMQKMKNI